MTPSGIETATFRFVAQHLNYCAIAVPMTIHVTGFIWFLTLVLLPEGGRRRPKHVQERGMNYYIHFVRVAFGFSIKTLAKCLFLWRNSQTLVLTFRHRASCILGQAFHYSPENAFYIFNQQIYFII
jgi:hypothetical protein